MIGSTSGETATGRRSGLERLRSRVGSTLGPLLRGAERIALVDFPNYPNVGDSAIFLGQLACLRSLGAPRPCFVCDARTYDRDELRRRLGRDGTILLAGGGGFGDLWEEGQLLREDVVRSFPDHPVVQLPQSVHFESDAALDRARRVYGAHPDLVFLAREQQSLRTVRHRFDLRVRLCPDMALCLGETGRATEAAVPLLWLARTDREATADPAPAAGAALRRDWLDEPDFRLRRLADELIALVRRWPRSRSLRAALRAAYAPLARARVGRGLRILSEGRVVITDRLHGHILCLLAGIPHVVHDNSYGKLSSFHDTWTSGLPGVHWAGSREEALRAARRLARRGPVAPGPGDGRRA